MSVHYQLQIKDMAEWIADNTFDVDRPVCEKCLETVVEELQKNESDLGETLRRYQEELGKIELLPESDDDDEEIANVSDKLFLEIKFETSCGGCSGRGATP